MDNFFNMKSCNLAPAPNGAMDGDISTLPPRMAAVLVEIRNFTLSVEVKKRLLVESSSSCTTGIRTAKAVCHCQVVLYRG
jgi:hypothetical protein